MIPVEKCQANTLDEAAIFFNVKIINWSVRRYAFAVGNIYPTLYAIDWTNSTDELTDIPL